MGSTEIVSLIGVVALALLQLFAGPLRGHTRVRSAWLSAASGMAIAYVFVHLLPDLAREQQLWLEARPDRRLDWLDSQVYLAALIGVVLSLGLDRRAHQHRGRGYWLHLASFAIYSAMIGGFALRLTGVVSMLLALLAFGAHFLLNDHRMEQHYGPIYVRTGRWVLAASLLVGWLIAKLWEPSVIAVAALLGLLSGGIVSNVIKEELPERDTSRFAPWVAGALGYAALLITLGYTQRA